MHTVVQTLSGLTSPACHGLYIEGREIISHGEIADIHATRGSVLGLLLSAVIDGNGESLRYPSHSAGRLTESCRFELLLRDSIFGDDIAGFILRQNEILNMAGAFDMTPDEQSEAQEND